MYRSSRFGRLQGIKCAVAGKNLYMRFTCSTGDAMGMNMVSKGVQNVLDFLQSDFPDMDVMGISGNTTLFHFTTNVLHSRTIHVCLIYAHRNHWLHIDCYVFIFQPPHMYDLYISI